MMLETLRRMRAPIAGVTLVMFWNATLHVSFARAQSLPPEPSSSNSSSNSNSNSNSSSNSSSEGQAAQGTYDQQSRQALKEHLAGAGQAGQPSQAAPAAAPADKPAAQADVDRALAALPAGGTDVSPQATALPTGAGTTLGMGESFTMQLSTGTAGYSVPITLPSARGGAQPKLGLVYSAAAGFGVAGYGWSIGAAAISRQTDRGLPKYDDRASWHPEQDRFVFGGSELVPICMVSGGACSGAIPGESMPAWSNGWQYFRARAEGLFLRFFWSPDHRTWRVQSKDGVNLELGVPLDGSAYEGGLEFNPDDHREIYRWHLTRQYDTQGGANAPSGPTPVNLAVYRYTRDGNVVYLTDIFDTTPASSPTSTNLALYAHHTRLSYEPRPDVLSSYRAGYFAEHALRLRLIDVSSKPFSGGTGQARHLLRRYRLIYQWDSHRSLLAALQMEGRCTTPVTENASQILPDPGCDQLPELQFEYQGVSGGPRLQDAQGYLYEAFDGTVRTLASSPPHSLDEARTTLADINADGLQDVLVTAPGLFEGSHGVFFNGLDRQGLNGFGSASRMGLVPAAQVTDTNVLSIDNPVVSPLDLDGDGILDLVHMPQAKRYAVFSPRPTAPGSKNYRWEGRAINTASQQDVKIDFTREARNTRVMDVNGDGLVDVVYSAGTELQTFFALGRYPQGDGQFGQALWTGAASAQISNEPVVRCLPWSSEPVRFSDPDTAIADMNGDGLADIVRLRSGQIQYWPARGNGFWGAGARDDCARGFAQNRHIAMSNAPRFGTSLPGRLLLNDVNGDGLADLVELRNQGVDIYLNDNGVGFTQRHTIADGPFLPNDSQYARLTDVNGSGTPDILWGRAHDYKYIDLTGGRTPGALVRVNNGMGKTLDLEYASTAELMLDAARSGTPWSSVAPTTMPVLVSTVARDNLETIGRPGGAYVTQYSYRDPVYDGRQREFRGFREVTTTTPGDANSPTSHERTVFLLGECSEAYTGTNADVCSPALRWQDSWREPLKGLSAVSEVYNDSGVYLFTDHTTYEMRRLYNGLDGRRVTVAMPSATDSYRYDTSSFDHASSVVSALDVAVLMGEFGANEMRSLTIRATAGTAHLRRETFYDDFGNVTDAVHKGCISGCPSGAADEWVSVHSDYSLNASDQSRWLWRETHTFTEGSINTGRRNEQYRNYDQNGNLEESHSILTGTLALDRFHASGGAIAPAPTAQSGGVSTSATITVADPSYDSFGHVTFLRTPNSRCKATDFDTDYASLPVRSRLYVGAVDGATNCGTLPLIHDVVYDRGLEAVTNSTDARGQPSEFVYDAFGRLASIRDADPTNPGQLAAYARWTRAYLVNAPFSMTVTQELNGPDANSNGPYHATYEIFDGMGRMLRRATEADMGAGDGGPFVAQGDVEYDAKGAPARIHVPEFWDGNAFSVSTTPYSAREYDAFGRIVRTYALDQQIESMLVPHALSSDLYDAEDILPTSHQNSYSTTIVDGHGREVEHVQRVKVGSQMELRSVRNEWLPTGEILRVSQLNGSASASRWFRYDSLGRMVANVEPNTSVGFNPSPTTPITSIKAYRYAYNDSGDVVGFSDARGCGANYHYDGGGRLLAEDRSPCLSFHAAYSAPNLSSGDGTEAFYRYDTADPDNSSIFSQHPGFTFGTAYLIGRLSSVSGLGAKAVYRYDALGRQTGVATRIQVPGAAPTALATRYAPRWYAKTAQLDVMDRPLTESTGATLPELVGADGTSELRYSYTHRGLVHQVDSSYGMLLASSVSLADGRPESVQLGDATATQRYFTYNAKLRPQAVQTYRGSIPLWTNPPAGSSYTPPLPADDPTLQLLLEDVELVYDEVGNITRLEDHRIDVDWPASAKPVTRAFEYDDLYRLTRATYQYPNASVDTWKSPYARENQDSTRVQPAPHVSFAGRPTEQRYQYDWLGNVSQSTDDQQAFWDRSSGDRVHGASGPNVLGSASNRTLAPSSARKGDLSAVNDGAGQLSGLIVRRDGACLPTGASCWQRFAYEWNEVGQLTRARRWDLTTAERTNNGQLAQPVPARAADADLRYGYDAGGARTLKTAVDLAGTQRHSAYIFAGLELRSTTWSGTEYALSPQTLSVRLMGGGVSARVYYEPLNAPQTTTSRQHLLLEFSDHLGTGTFSVDHRTGELVEYATHQPYGAIESDYRPNRWQGFREAYKFTGKEEDIQVGLVYFGARYYSPYLGVWISPDPLTIHDLGADLNPYAYVGGMPIVAYDPDGRFAWIAFIVVVAISAIVSAAANIAAQSSSGQPIDWGLSGVSGAFLSGAAAGAVSGGIGGVITAPLSAAIGATAGTITSAAIAGAAGSFTGYTTGVGLSQGGKNPQTWSGSHAWTATWTGAVSSAASAGISGAMASTGAYGAASQGAQKAFGNAAGKAFGRAASEAGRQAGKATVEALASGLTAAVTTTTIAAARGQSMDAREVLIASVSAAASTAASSMILNSLPSKSPQGGERQRAANEAKRQEARQARDTLAAELARWSGHKRPATVSAGYHTETGQVVTGCSGGGTCAEVKIVEQLGGDPSKVNFVEAVRPRVDGPPFRQVPVCISCEQQFTREPFPPNTTKFQSDE